MDTIPCSSSASSSSWCCYEIPWDVIPKILCRLPVASLVRFRSVTKSWRDLIDSKYFSKLHLSHSNKSNAYMKLMIFDSRTRLFSIDLGVVEQQHSISLDSHVLDYQPFRLFTRYQVLVLGSCNGLLCLRNPDSTLLFNPSTMRYQYMPIGRPIPPSSSATIFGFGYDDVNDDYKLVMMVGTSSAKGYVVHVYSLKLDSWTMIEQVISYPFPFEKSWGRFVGGALHWVLTKRSELNRIVAFDVAKEVFREVRTPMIKDNAYCRVDVLGGKLCFACDYNRFDSPSYMEIWVMKEYGVESSWTKLVSFVSDSYIETVPLAYSNCGKKLLVQKGYNLCWYDLEDKGRSCVELTRESKFIDPYVLVESLVPLKHIINTSGAPKGKRELLL